jgi:hypothetical protein
LEPFIKVIKDHLQPQNLKGEVYTTTLNTHLSHLRYFNAYVLVTKFKPIKSNKLVNHDDPMYMSDDTIYLDPSIAAVSDFKADGFDLKFPRPTPFLKLSEVATFSNQDSVVAVWHENVSLSSDKSLMVMGNPKAAKSGKKSTAKK